MLILGLACATSQHHAAALVGNGRVLGMAEEERFVRKKGFGAAPRPDANLINDESLTLSDVFPRHSVAWLCEMAGVQYADVDLIAINGIPAKFRSTYSLSDRSLPPRIIRHDRYVFVPHHLAHAASTYRLSGFDEAVIVTIDGRGERETACAFTARGDRISRGLEVLVGNGGSIGGAYETVTRMLGFGAFGQGSTMALASFGMPTMDLEDSFALGGHQQSRIDEARLGQLVANIERTRDAALTATHENAAASVQAALERCVQTLLDEILPEARGLPLCLAGGVALNCTMNRAIAARDDVSQLFVTPAAHDAGTALGAALEAAVYVGEAVPRTRLACAALGPSYDTESCIAACRRAGVKPTTLCDVPSEVARRLAGGQIIAWFEGRMEAGPRALGQRSLLADPRRCDAKDRLNRMKGREYWRPFAPSILAGHEPNWFIGGTCSPFMLRTFFIRDEQAEKVPAILHVDGTTRPQSVEPGVLPRYAALIRAFFELTGVPMVVNTSLNAPGDPIVCTPDHAIDAFIRLKADALVLGELLIEGAGT